ncbi:MAG TPA: YetF domain-containing protein [Acidimicrobiia bacterium]|nr:YetF domain-containing protein [Acidimicrobiia bacterium]
MEIVLRTAVVFGVLFVLLRALGKRELAEMSPFELIMLVILGDIVQQGVTQEDMSITGALLAVSTIAVLIVGMSYVAFRFPRTRGVLEGTPTVLVRHGHVVREALRAERVTTEELEQAARSRGITSLRDVDLAVLEGDGTMTFIGPRVPAPATTERPHRDGP